MKNYRSPYYAKNRDKVLKQQKEWALKNADKIKQYKLKRKKMVIEYYSNGNNCCACCGESIFEFLTIDHMNNDGAEHRRQMEHGGRTIYRWLIQHDFPKGFQVLCYNCNCAKGHHGICPHKK